MCNLCAAICRQIERAFGHRVDPKELARLIERSPLAEREEEE
jgi:hypothetical protein